MRNVDSNRHFYHFNLITEDTVKIIFKLNSTLKTAFFVYFKLLQNYVSTVRFKPDTEIYNIRINRKSVTLRTLKYVLVM